MNLVASLGSILLSLSLVAIVLLQGYIVAIVASLVFSTKGSFPSSSLSLAIATFLASSSKLGYLRVVKLYLFFLLGFAFYNLGTIVPLIISSSNSSPLY